MDKIVKNVKTVQYAVQNEYTYYKEINT